MQYLSKVSQFDLFDQEMNDLLKFIEENGKHRHINKPSNFLTIYETLLSKYRNTDVSLVEVGVGEGGSLQLWKNYLGPKAFIYGIDIHPSRLEESQIKEFVADQGNREALKHIASLIPKIDILIDDGSHICSHQINTFEEIFPYVSMGGLYVCEDLHTSYRNAYEGGYKKLGSFIEYCKDLIDSLNFREDDRIRDNALTRMVDSMTLYSSMVVIKKVLVK